MDLLLPLSGLTYPRYDGWAINVFFTDSVLCEPAYLQSEIYRIK